jgi:iron complex outermembrane receptor protein
VGARALTEDANNLVQLLIDGREAMIEVIGFAYWSGLTVNLTEIERIEVIRGPGSTLYGANAFAAVVNITTVKEKIANGADVAMITGQEGHTDLFGRARGRFELGQGALTYSAGFGTVYRDCPKDVRDNFITGWRSHGYLRYQHTDVLDVSLHAGMVVGELQNYFHMGDMRLTEAINYWIMGKSEHKLFEGLRLKAQVYHSRYVAIMVYRTSLRAYDIWIGDVADFDVNAPTVDGQLQLDYQATDNLLLTSGANLRYTAMKGIGLIPEKASELRGAGFVHAQWHPWPQVQFTGGLRLDFNTKTEPALSPRAVVVFRPWEDHSWRLGYALAFRKPSMFERDLSISVKDYNSALPSVVDTLARELGNGDLVNEKVHSIEAGWRSNFLDGRLSLSLDLFYNIYKDTIYFYVNIPYRVGLPDIANSEFHYENQGAGIHALGGELEISWRPWGELVLWGNVGTRLVTDTGKDERMEREPVVRFNLGGGYRPESGIQIDVSLHYVSRYEMPLMDPENLFTNPMFMPLGKTALVIGRAGYRLNIGQKRMIECGLMFRTPVGNPFREYAGIPFPETLRSQYNSDFGGALLHPWFSFYLRGSF